MKIFKFRQIHSFCRHFVGSAVNEGADSDNENINNNEPNASTSPGEHNNNT